MARGNDRGHNRRPTQFGDGSNAWKTSRQKEDTPPLPVSDMQEHAHEPTEDTSKIETLDEPEIQVEKYITTSQLLQILVQ